MTARIDLLVNSAPVEQAKRAVSDLTNQMSILERASVDLGGQDLARDAELLRQASMDVTRLGALVRSGESKGGILDSKQWQDAAAISKRVGDNLGGWLKHTKGLREELSSIIGDLEGLNKASFDASLSPSTRNAVLTEMQSLEARKAEVEAEMKARSRLEPRAETLQRRAGEYGGALSTFGQAQGHDPSIKSMLGYGLAMFGGISVLSMLRESWEKHKQQSQLETGLAVRGVQFSSQISRWNYMPQEQAEIAMGLRRTTGARDMGTQDRFSRFARLSNLDTGSALGFVGGYYQATGSDVTKQRQAIDALLVLGKAAKDGRTEALLTLINANMLSAQQAQGGRELSSEKVASVMATTRAMYNAGGTLGFTPHIFNTMQNALMPGGDQSSEILKWDLSGGFDGELTPQRIIEIQKTQSRGLNDPETRKRLNKHLQNYSSDRYAQILEVERVMNLFGTQGGADLAEGYLDMFGPGGSLTGEKDPQKVAKGLERHLKGKTTTGVMKKKIDEATGDFTGSPGYDVGQRAVAKERAKIEAGKGIEKILGPIENSALSGVNSAFDELSGVKSRWRADIEKHKGEPKKFSLLPDLGYGIGDKFRSMFGSDDKPDGPALNGLPAPPPAPTSDAGTRLESAIRSLEGIMSQGFDKLATYLGSIDQKTVKRSNSPALNLLNPSDRGR